MSKKLIKLSWIFLITDWIDLIADWIDLITDWIDLITNWIDLITYWIDLITSQIDLITNWIDLITDWIHLITNLNDALELDLNYELIYELTQVRFDLITNWIILNQGLQFFSKFWLFFSLACNSIICHYVGWSVSRPISLKYLHFFFKTIFEKKSFLQNSGHCRKW